MTDRKALITGIAGQHGLCLADLLLEEGYAVHHLIRRASTFNSHLTDHPDTGPHDEDARLFLHCGDLTDGSRLVTLMERLHPEEAYHLAAQLHVRASFDEPEFTAT